MPTFICSSRENNVIRTETVRARRAKGLGILSQKQALRFRAPSGRPVDDL